MLRLLNAEEFRKEHNVSHKAYIAPAAITESSYKELCV